MALYRCIAARCRPSVPAAWFDGGCSAPQDWRRRKSLEEARVLTAQLELKHLRYAVAATRYRSFRKAADALGVKQSTLSRGIAQLEARLGVILFERTSGGDRLTMAGDEILRTSMPPGRNTGSDDLHGPEYR